MLDQLELTLKRNALKFHAGQAIFCPSCQTILDCRRAVEIDASKDGKLVTSKIACAKCYDGHIKANLQGMKLPEGVTVEINDGRELFARPRAAKKTRKAPKPKLDMERVMEAAQEGDGTGFCTACGEEQGGCEPDARRRICDSCGAPTVYGAEEILMMQ